MLDRVPKEEPIGIDGASFLQAGYHSCHPTNSIKALNDYLMYLMLNNMESFRVFKTIIIFWTLGK